MLAIALKKNVLIAVIASLFLLLGGLVVSDYLVMRHCVLYGRSLSETLKGIDIVVSSSARYLADGDSDLHPAKLIRSGLASRVHYEGRLYFLNGPFLASRSLAEEELPNSWRIDTGVSRKLSWFRNADRIRLSSPQGREFAFFEQYRRGVHTCRSDAGRALGILQTLGVLPSSQEKILPAETSSQEGGPPIAIQWIPSTTRAAATEDMPSPGCPKAIRFTVDDVPFSSHALAVWARRIHMDKSELHPQTRPMLACIGSSLYVLQHQSEDMLALNRFDLSTETWSGTIRLLAPKGVLIQAMRPELDKTSLRITMQPGMGMGPSKGPHEGLIKLATAPW